jgi:Domain of unknown function (DUF4440)
MRGFVTTVSLAALIIGSSFLTAAEPAVNPEKEVVSLLRKLNDAFVKADADMMKQLMADNQVSILNDGQRRTREEQLKSLSDLKLTEYTMEDVKFSAPAPGVAIVTYAVKQKGTFKGKELPTNLMASSVWTHQGGKWQEVLYQETPVKK